MFAIPGWNVTSKLKKQTTSVRDDGTDGPARKKKRRNGPSAGIEPVTKENVAELWDKVIDGERDTGSVKTASKSSGEPQESNKKKRKKKAALEGTAAATELDVQAKPAPASAGETHEPIDPVEASESKQNGLSNKDKKKLKGAPKGPVSMIATFSTTSLPLSSTLTPHQQQLRNKLLASRFRHLNEQFYTSPSEEIFSQIKDSPSLLEDYHVGFRQAASHWPENPLDAFIQNLRDRGRVRRKGDLQGEPLPRDREGFCHIVDVGCGDARLQRTLHTQAKKLGLAMSSFDLAASTDGIVQAADASSLPIAAGSAQVVIFCLSLMGSNWPSFVDEAYRVLSSRGGELWVAEIKSRFIEPSQKPLPAASLSRKRKSKPKPASEQDADDGGLALELEDENRRIEKEGETVDRTPIEPFIVILKKRGFELKRDGVNRANKMFVRLEFLKRARDQELSSVLDDGRVLKACSYKLR